jgi:hypothetical protein
VFRDDENEVAKQKGKAFNALENDFQWHFKMIFHPPDYHLLRYDLTISIDHMNVCFI